MARIELKYSKIRFRDGYTNTAAVNQASDAPANADTRLEIDTLAESGVIPVSSRFTVVGSTRTYTVTESDANAQLDIDLDDASAGTFTITIGGQTTDTIAFGAIQSAIQSAVDLLSNVEPGDFLVTKVGPLVTVKAISTGLFANEAVVMSFDGTALTATDESGVQTYAGGVTHALVFTPALATADGIPVDGAVITLGGRSLEVNVGTGNLEFTENREFLYDLDRGLLDTVREGDQVPMDVSLDFIWEFLTAISGSDTPTISDVLHHRGAAADWVSSSADECESYCFDIEIEYTPPCGGANTEIITLPDFRWESLPHSMTDSQVSMTGRCNATEAIIARL